jgi:hypothetical protein
MKLQILFRSNPVPLKLEHPDGPELLKQVADSAAKGGRQWLWVSPVCLIESTDIVAIGPLPDQEPKA